MTTQRTAALLATFVLFFASVAVYAGDALPQLKGTWVAETINGQAPKKPAKLVMTFVDDDTLASEVTGPNGKTTKVEIKYQAKADGTIIMFPDPDNPVGEEGTWKVDEDGKLHIKSKDDDAMVLVKQK